MPQDSTVTDLNDLFDAGRQIRRRFEPDAYLNVAFYLGRQWTRWDGTQIFGIPEDSTEQTTDNRIGPFIRTEIARMTKTQPQWVAVPRTQSDQDQAATKYAVMALDDAWKRHNLLRKLRGALLWSRVTGAGFWKVWWDPSRGPKRDVLVYGQQHPNAGQLVRDQYGAPMRPELAHTLPPEAGPEQRSVAMGDICVDLRSFFQIVTDPLASEEGLDSAEWIAEEAVYSRDYCRKHFPQLYEKLSFDADPQAGAMESRMPFGGVYDQSTTAAGKGIVLREYWSEGKYCCWAPNDNIVLKEDRNPYPWLPYVMFRGQPAPGRFWPHSVVTDARPRQVDLNKTSSQIQENGARIGNPPAARDSRFNDQDEPWQGLPGEYVDFTGDGSGELPFRFIPVPEMPAYIQNNLQRIEDSLREIFGQHEVTGANVPPGVTAASAISLLQEQDDTRLGPDVGEMEQTIADAGRRMLFLIRNYYTDERHIQVAGEDGQWDVEAFKGDMTNGVEDIEVQSGSGMPESKAGKQAAIERILQMIMQNNPTLLSARDLRKVTQEFQVGGLEAFFSNISRTYQQVQDENRQLLQGVTLGINSYDEDEEHVDYHEDFMRSSRYQQAVQQNPLVGRNTEEHVAMHRDRMAQKAMSLAMGGAPPAPGGPPGPPGAQQMQLSPTQSNGGQPPVPSGPSPG
jgi:hypothetical protein